MPAVSLVNLTPNDIYTDNFFGDWDDNDTLFQDYWPEYRDSDIEYILDFAGSYPAPIPSTAVDFTATARVDLSTQYGWQFFYALQVYYNGVPYGQIYNGKITAPYYEGPIAIEFDVSEAVQSVLDDNGSDPAILNDPSFGFGFWGQGTSGFFIDTEIVYIAGRYLTLNYTVPGPMPGGVGLICAV